MEDICNRLAFLCQLHSLFPGSQEKSGAETVAAKASVLARHWPCGTRGRVSVVPCMLKARGRAGAEQAGHQPLCLSIPFSWLGWAAQELLSLPPSPHPTHSPGFCELRHSFQIPLPTRVIRTCFVVINHSLRFLRFNIFSLFVVGLFLFY